MLFYLCLVLQVEFAVGALTARVILLDVLLQLPSVDKLAAVWALNVVQLAERRVRTEFLVVEQLLAIRAGL